MSIKQKSIYLDYAAATPTRHEVAVAMQPWLTEKFHNPSSLYAAAREAKSALEDSRQRIAQVLGAKKSEIVFTSGGTESVNLAVLGAVRALRKRISKPKLNIVTSAIEHQSVLACVNALGQEDITVRVAPASPSGGIDPAVVERLIDDNTVFVTVMYANNEIGTIQPVTKIGQMIEHTRQDRRSRRVDTPLYFHTDAAQAAGALDLHVSRLKVDLLSLNASKIYGPKQFGCLYVRTGVPIEPLILGGGQESGRRSGIQNVAGASGFALALELAQLERTKESIRLAQLRDRLLARLRSSIPDLIVNGHEKRRLPGNLNLSIPGIDGQAAVLYLDQAGIQVSTGSACSTETSEPSHVLLSIGRSRAAAASSLRFTLGHQTVQADIDHVSVVLPQIVSRLRQITN